MVKSRRSTSCARIAFEAHLRGAAAVGVIVVAAEGGHLHLRAAVAHQHHAELRAHQARAGEQLQDAVRPRVGGDVEILRLRAQQQVAHRSRPPARPGGPPRGAAR